MLFDTFNLLIEYVVLDLIDQSAAQLRCLSIQFSHRFARAANQSENSSLTKRGDFWGTYLLKTVQNST
jgi:hypothetical protein